MKKIIIIFLISIFFCFNQNCHAEVEYTIVEDLGEVTFSDSAGGTGSAPRIRLQTSDGKSFTAWCKDPHVSGIVGTGTTYTEKTVVDSTALSAYQNIFNNTCGDESMQVATLRTVATGLDDYIGTADPSGRYQSLYDGNLSYGGDAEKFEQLIHPSLEENVLGSSSINKTQPDSQTMIFESDTALESSASSYCTTREESGKFITTCSLPDEYCENGGDPLDFNLGDGTPDNAGDGAGDGSDPSECAPCQVKVFTLKSAGGEEGTSVQEFIACIDSEGNSRGPGGQSYDSDNGLLSDDEINDLGSADADYGSYTLSCDDYYEEPIDCDPGTNYISNEGSEMCSSTGATVIKVDELFNEDDDSIKNCMLNDDMDYASNQNIATELIFSDKNEYYAYDDPEDLSLCSIHCAEDFEMKLPGPDAKFSNDEVMVNAGTFFTISGNISNTTTVKCYMQQNYENLVYAIDKQRKITADAYTATKMKEAADKGFQTLYNRGTCVPGKESCVPDPETGVETCECLEYYWYPIWKQPAYEGVSLTPSRSNISASYNETLKQLPTKKCEGTGKTAPSSCSSTKTELLQTVKNEIDSLFSYAGCSDLSDCESKAKEKIENAKTIWNTNCSEGWNFNNINELIYKKDSCQTKLSFWYDEYLRFGNEFGKAEVVFKNAVPVPSTTNAVSKSVGKPKNGLCTSTGCNKSSSINDLNGYEYVMKSEVVTTTYELQDYFCNPFDSTKMPFFCGSQTECENVCGDSVGDILRGFPVALETPRGRYTYRFDYNGIGHLFDKDKCFNSGGVGESSYPIGRLEYIIERKYSYGERDYDNSCMYSVNTCPTCGVQCLDKGNGYRSGIGCNLDFGCNKGCKVACVGGGCILDINAGFLVTYRTLSLNDAFPNDPPVAFFAKENKGLLAAETLLALGPIPAGTSSPVSSTNNFNGSNWDTKKSKAVRKEIEQNGEKIYNEDPQYKIKLTPDKTQKIREYNKDNTEYTALNGTYGKIGTGNYEYAVYKSTFIDDYFDGSDDIATRKWIPLNDTTELLPTIYNSEVRNIEKPFTGPALK